MPQSYYCSSCDTYFWPYMCADSKCPCCWGGLKRSQEPGSIDADAKFKAAMAKRVEVDEKARRYERFEKYYAERQKRLAQQPNAYLRCVGCGWVFPIDTTDENERCSECEGELEIAHDDEQHGECDVAA